MNLKFLKTINITEEAMSPEEISSYLGLLYKKCSKSSQTEFNDYLKEQYGTDKVNLDECGKLMCDDDNYTEMVKHLENISNKLDENSLLSIIGKGANQHEEDA